MKFSVPHNQEVEYVENILFIPLFDQKTKKDVV